MSKANDGREYFTATVDGLPRALFHFKQTSEDTLVISINTGQWTRPSGMSPETLPRDTVAYKKYNFTVHLSPNSPDGISVIHLHTHDECGVEVEKRLITKVFKEGANFAFLAARRTPSLRNDRYLLEHPWPAHNIGSYEPFRYSLRYAIFLGAADSAFPTRPKDELRITAKKVGPFKIVVVHSLAEPPSLIDGFTRTIHTLAEDDLRVVLGGITEEQRLSLANGFPVDECFVMAKRMIAEVTAEGRATTDQLRNALRQQGANPIIRDAPDGTPIWPDLTPLKAG